MAEPKWGDSAYDLLFKTVQGLEPFVSTFVGPKWGDSFWDLLYKLNANLGSFTGGSGTAQVVNAPSSVTDFSMLPGGVAPTSGVYWAPKDSGSLWTIEAGDAQWTEVFKSNP